MSLLAYLIWPIYAVLSLVVFHIAIQPHRSGTKRGEIYALAFSIMCLSMGRLLYATDPNGLPEYRWIFDIAHIGMIAHVVLLIYNFRIKMDEGENCEIPQEENEGG